MEESTHEDWAIILPEAMAMAKSLPDRVQDHLRLLDGDHGGFPVDRLTHTAFDPAIDALPLSHFEPMLRRLMAVPKSSVYKAALPGGTAAA